VILLGAMVVVGQDGPRGVGERPEAGGPSPRLPGAVTKAPDWIGADAPFDVDRYFAAVPADRNAGPLYLDALFEFGADLAVCFPEGPERERRRRAADDRMKQYMPLSERLRKAEADVPPEAIDAVIALYETGFRKLAESQKRDRCVFETGIAAEGPVAPHLLAARQVARVASLRVRRAVDRRDFDAAIREVVAVLRLARDLQPRGPMINQLVADAIIQVVCADMVKTILAGGGLRVEHCDRLLKVLLDDEARSSDGYAEGLRAEYLVTRSSLREIERTKPQLNALTTPAQRERLVRDLNDYYRSMLDLEGRPYAGRIATIGTLKITSGNDPLARMIAMLGPAMVPFVQAAGRTTATLRATQCLIVMRRWELTHRGLPRALAVAVKEAGLKAIPMDPYDGRPMRTALLEGRPAVYSVGKDGLDDGGLKDSKYDTQPGDLIYRMPTADARR
jgi:hypothetical protein